MQFTDIQEMIDILKKPAEYSLDMVSAAMRAIAHYSVSTAVPAAELPGGPHEYAIR